MCAAVLRSLLLVTIVLLSLQPARGDIVPSGSGPWLVVDDVGRPLGGVFESSIGPDSISVHVRIETAHGPGLVALTGSDAVTPGGGLAPLDEALNLWFTSSDCSGSAYYIVSGSMPFRYRDPDGAWVFVGGPTAAVYSATPASWGVQTIRSWIAHTSGTCAALPPTQSDALALTPEGDLSAEFVMPFAIVAAPGSGALVSVLGDRAQALLALALVLMLAFRNRARPAVARAR
jgi:hypothetical protein